jgi:hypothetical protein
LAESACLRSRGSRSPLEQTDSKHADSINLADDSNANQHLRFSFFTGDSHLSMRHSQLIARANLIPKERNYSGFALLIGEIPLSEGQFPAGKSRQLDQTMTLVDLASL